MKTKKYEFHNKDIPDLKKDICFRIIFSFIFFAIFIWQFALLIMSSKSKNINILSVILGSIVMITSIMLALFSLVYAQRFINLTQRIKRNGKAIMNITILFNVRKKSFIKLYAVVAEILAVIMLLILTCSITYSILQYIYYSKVATYLPLLLTICFAGFNSVYHLNSEIKTIERVQEYNNIFS